MSTPTPAQIARGIASVCHGEIDAIEPQEDGSRRGGRPVSTRTPAEVMAKPFESAWNEAVQTHDPEGPALDDDQMNEFVAGVLSKALAALAESPDVVERVARALDPFVRPLPHGRDWSDAMRDAYERHAVNDFTEAREAARHVYVREAATAALVALGGEG